MKRPSDAAINVHVTGIVCAALALVGILLPMARPVATLHPWTRIAVPLVLICGLGVVTRWKLFAIALSLVLVFIAVKILIAGIAGFTATLFFIECLAIAVLLAPVIVLYRNRRALR